MLRSVDDVLMKRRSHCNPSSGSMLKRQEYLNNLNYIKETVHNIIAYLYVKKRYL